jgi:hypothetical protein
MTLEEEDLSELATGGWRHQHRDPRSLLPPVAESESDQSEASSSEQLSEGEATWWFTSL